MPVYSFLTIRYIIATGIMFVIWKGKILQELKNISLKKYIVPSICMASAFIFSNMALRYTAATNVAFLRSLSALIAPFLMLITFKKRYGTEEIELQLEMLGGLYLLCAKGGLSTFGIGEVPVSSHDRRCCVCNVRRNTIYSWVNWSWNNYCMCIS